MARLSTSVIGLASIILLGACSDDTASDALPTGTAPIIDVLMRSALETDDASEIMVRTHHYAPGWQAPRHFHSSDLFIYVLEGEFEVTMEPLGRVVYTAGQAMRMEPATQMDARNPSDTNDLRLVVFQVGHLDDPFVVPVE